MSLLPEPSTFEKRYSDDEKLASELPDRPITSLRDLQYVYGRLYTLATAGGGEYAAYLTPEKSTDLFDEPESLLYLRVDLSGDKARLDPDQPIGVESYGEEKVEAVAHSWYNAAKDSTTVSPTERARTKSQRRSRSISTNDSPRGQPTT